ncbi:MAG: hypothetical protein V2A78_03455 [bacterium]
MKKPVLIVKDNLLMPIFAMEGRTSEIQKEMDCASSSPVVLNGLFLMLVSYFESMRKEVLQYYLKYEPDRIPTKKTIEIDKNILIENEGFRLIECLVSEYINRMPNWQFIQIFYEVLKIKKPEIEQSIDEIKKRRNELIHDNMQVDFKQSTVLHKSIDSDYLAHALGEYNQYLAYLRTEISRVYNKCTKVNALKSLWHFIFRTPLCANFEDYWHIDSEQDCLVGCKTPEYEVNLSHSEKFMIDIWRSQVRTGNVGFLNMASLDQRTQSCLYMFLKLSNDIFLYH